MQKKKGFTLIELMIVLAVIAILAVVLVPRAGIFKNQAREQGIITNINTVRAVLEKRVDADYTGTIDVAVIRGNVNTALNSALGTNVTNPLSRAATITSQADAPAAAVTPAPAVLIFDDNVAATTPTAANTFIPGTVVVDVYNNGYVVYGVGNTGNIINPIIIN